MVAALNSKDVTAATRFAVNAPWLVKLRWVALVGQMATIAIVHLALRIELPLAPLGVALAVTAATNAALGLSVRKQIQTDVPGRFAWPAIAAVMLLDLLVLTAMLYVTGGMTNPFVVFYFVNVALAGVLVEPTLAWTLELVAVCGVAILMWNHWELPLLQEPARLRSLSAAEKPSMVLFGDFVAFVASSGVIVAFMTRLNSELRESEQARRRAEDQRARAEKLEALGTLAAGAAHELATPLSTIAVVATEMERELAAESVSDEVTSDLKLIRSELARCRNILDRMAIDSGQMIGENACELSVSELCEAIIEGLRESDLIDQQLGDAGDCCLRIPPISTTQALRGLVQNALDAGPGESVTLSAKRTGGQVQLTIADRGPGMTGDVLTRAGEPFFTTKQPGQGMGLGLFLARSVVERLGGTLRLESEPGEGTRAVVELPLCT